MTPFSFFNFLRNFKNDPFATLDSLDLRYGGFQFNVLRDDEKLRKVVFQIFFLTPLLLWLLLGADSTADQLAYFLWNIPSFLLQKITFNQLLEIYNSWYGLGTHWSAPVIYSLLLIGISKHLREKLDVRNSLNLSLTTGFVGLTIASFEFFWLGSYYFWQNQHWILTLQFPQGQIIIRNMLFALVGMIVLLGLNWKEYKFNIDKITILSFLATIGLVWWWWFYPFSTEQLVVGNWVSSIHFPQNMYIVNVDSTVAYGIAYHIENAGVHLVNNLTKIAMTLTFYSLFRIKHR